jgi:hypothetical protein
MEFDSWDVMDWCLKNYNRGVVIPGAGTLSRQARLDAPSRKDPRNVNLI